MLLYKKGFKKLPKVMFHFIVSGEIAFDEVFFAFTFSFKTRFYLFIYFFACRSSHPDVLLRKGVPKVCIKFTGEYPCRSVISIKKFPTSLKSRFSMGLLNIFRRIFPKYTSGWLLMCMLLDPPLSNFYLVCFEISTLSGFPF